MFSQSVSHVQSIAKFWKIIMIVIEGVFRKLRGSFVSVYYSNHWDSDSNQVTLLKFITIEGLLREYEKLFSSIKYNFSECSTQVPTRDILFGRAILTSYEQTAARRMNVVFFVSSIAIFSEVQFDTYCRPFV